MSNPNNAISLENPTSEYLHDNYNKVQLQKYCREIGITKVYVTKAKLVELIMEKHRSPRPNNSDSSARENENKEISISEIMNIITELRERVNIRDMEIEDFGELLKAANVTINRLNDKVALLEDQVKILRENSGHGSRTTGEFQEGSMISQSTPPKGTLLLGDSNLIAVKTSDLDTSCSIRTIRGANTDLINCWVTEKLQWAPNNCVLYCGLQDILEDTTTATIFDRLGALVSSLKQINENMKIFICELAPAVRAEDYDDHINNFNTHLINWSETNGVTVIKSNLKFRLGTGEVDTLCFNTSISEQEENFLNRYGVIRLLDAIKNQCTLFKLSENWETNIRQTPSIHYLSRNRGQQQSEFSSNSWRDRTVTSRPTAGRNNHRSRFSPDDSIRYDHTNNIRKPDYNDGHRLHYGNDYSDNQEDAYFPSWRQKSRQQNFYQRDRRQTRPFNNLRPAAEFRQVQPSDGRPYYRPCYNCGETNHSNAECRFQHRVRCNNCSAYGHKTRLCNKNRI